MAGTRVKNLLLCVFFVVIFLIYTNIDSILQYVPVSPQKLPAKTAQGKITAQYLKNVGNSKTLHVKKTINVKEKVKAKIESQKRKKEQEQERIEKATSPLSWSTKCSNDVFLLILVISHPSNAGRRTAIRGSWADTYVEDHGKLKKLRPFQNGAQFSPPDIVRVVFVAGTTDDNNEMAELRGESKLYNDIVVGGLHESYRNLTLKTILALRWASSCKSTYLVKTDDDVFMNPVMLVEWLKQKPTQSFYTGWCNYGSIPVRDPNSKW